jgi:glycosyltransferase involved in cell wall biosynthesis
MKKLKIFFAFIFFVSIFRTIVLAYTYQPKFVIATASYNNEKWALKYLYSVFSQNYKNFRVLYCDDCSTDKTLGIVKIFAEHYQVEDKITLIHNTKRVGPHENYYNMIHSCRDDEIIIIVDGDDWIHDSQVLNHLSEVYKNPNVWITYGQYEEYPSGKVGCCQQIPEEVIKNNSIRSYKWVTSHMRTFYAWLYKKIKYEDLIFDGKFVKRAGDYAIMFPMVEMAGLHSRFIPEILYVYNRANENNYGKPLGNAFASVQERHRVCAELKKHPPYDPLLGDKTTIEKLCGFVC